MLDFIQDQVLGMQWFNLLIGEMLTRLGINTSGRAGGSLQFFLFDTFKITALLLVQIFLISYIQSYFPPERSRKIMGRFHGAAANSIAALLGTVTPFCSCSSIPIFIGFTKAGLPLGVTFSFLISSPMVDLGSLVLLTGVFGLKAACAYVIAGLAIAIAGGSLIERLHPESELEDLVKSALGAGIAGIPLPELSQKNRLSFAKTQALETFRKVFPYILLGVGIGALIHNWIPAVWVETVLGGSSPFAVVLAVLAGVPVYADIFGTIPVAEALLGKGALIGTVLAFMMAVTTLSLPSLIMLRKAVKPRLLFIFIAICVSGIILVGCAFNTMSGWLV